MIGRNPEDRHSTFTLYVPPDRKQYSHSQRQKRDMDEETIVGSTSSDDKATISSFKYEAEDGKDVDGHDFV